MQKRFFSLSSYLSDNTACPYYREVYFSSKLTSQKTQLWRSEWETINVCQSSCKFWKFCPILTKMCPQILIKPPTRKTSRKIIRLGSLSYVRTNRRAAPQEVMIMEQNNEHLVAQNSDLYSQSYCIHFDLTNSHHQGLQIKNTSRKTINVQTSGRE